MDNHGSIFSTYRAVIPAENEYNGYDEYYYPLINYFDDTSNVLTVNPTAGILKLQEAKEKLKSKGLDLSTWHEPTLTPDYLSKLYNLKDIKSSGKANKTVANYIKDYLRKNLDASLTDNQLAGIIGVMHFESGGLNTGAANNEEKNAGLNGYGEGLAQWSGSRKTRFMNENNGVSPKNASLELLLKFIVKECNERKKLMSEIRATDDPIKVASLWMLGYENGSENKILTPEEFTNVYKKNKLNGRDYNLELELRLLRVKLYV